MTWTEPHKIVPAHEIVTNTSITTVIINDQEWSINSRRFYGRNEIQVRLALFRDDDKHYNAVLWLPRDEQLEVVAPATKPWDGLKVGDVLATDAYWFIVIQMPKTDDKEPWLMSLERRTGTPGMRDLGCVSYCNWSWFEEKHGPMRRAHVSESHAKKGEVLGINFYQEALRAMDRDGSY